MRKFLFFLIISGITTFFYSCKECNCPDETIKGATSPEDPQKVVSLYEALNGGIDSASLAKDSMQIKSIPILESEAKGDIRAFFTGIRLRNPDMKCYVEIKNLKQIVRSLQAVSTEIDGIRIYTSEYTAATERTSQGHYAGKFHYILVPINQNGDEIKKLPGGGGSTIFNYNNDCPYSCPDIGKASLIEDQANKQICSNARPTVMTVKKKK